MQTDRNGERFNAERLGRFEPERSSALKRITFATNRKRSRFKIELTNFITDKEDAFFNEPVLLFVTRTLRYHYNPFS